MELMIVIAIIGILSSIALPNFIGSRDDSMLKNAARGLLGDIQKTRMRAIKDNQNWEIIFQPGSGYQIRITSTLAVQKTVTFAGKKSGVVYGNGNAINDIPDNPFVGVGDYITYTNDILVFQTDGTFRAGLTGSNIGNGYVYLANGKGTVFGIGTLASGVVIFKQWMGANWSN